MVFAASDVLYHDYKKVQNAEHSSDSEAMNFLSDGYAHLLKDHNKQDIIPNGDSPKPSIGPWDPCAPKTPRGPNIQQ